MAPATPDPWPRPRWPAISRNSARGWPGPRRVGADPLGTLPRHRIAGYGVNNTNSKADDIHPGTVVAITGQYFDSAGTVAVSQNGTTHVIGAATAHWSYSDRLIAATLPQALRPGPAMVTVVRADGRRSNSRLVTILAGGTGAAGGARRARPGADVRG